MYPSLRELRARRREFRAEDRPWWRPAVTPNVVALGLTSFFTDVSSEMVNSVVPLFLTFQLGFTHFEFGVFNGAYQVIAVTTALAGATFADRHRQYKEVAGVGYTVSAFSRIGLLVARNSWLPATALLYADRAAKGLRTAPRDALISLSALPRHVAEAFGFHRTLDTAGAARGSSARVSGAQRRTGGVRDSLLRWILGRADRRSALRAVRAQPSTVGLSAPVQHASPGVSGSSCGSTDTDVSWRRERR